MVGTVLSLLYDEVVRIWCYRWTAIVTAIVLFVAGAAYIVRMPDVYDSWAQIYVAKQTPLTAAAQNVSLVGDGYGSTYVVQKTLLNDQSLGKVAEQLNPALSRLSPAARQGAIATLRNQIEIVPDNGDGFTEFHYKATNPVRAYRVVQLLLNQFVSANQDRAQRDLGQADVFLDAQIAVYQRKLADSAAEDRRIPCALWQRRRRNRFRRGSERRRPMSRMRAPSIMPPWRATALRRRSSRQIAALEDRIAALRLQYTDQYPDVVAARQQLAQLQQRSAQPGKTGENPAVASGRAQLACRAGQVAQGALPSGPAAADRRAGSGSEAHRRHAAQLLSGTPVPPRSRQNVAGRLWLQRCGQVPGHQPADHSGSPVRAQPDAVPDCWPWRRRSRAALVRPICAAPSPASSWRPGNWRKRSSFRS